MMVKEDSAGVDLVQNQHTSVNSEGVGPGTTHTCLKGKIKAYRYVCWQVKDNHTMSRHMCNQGRRQHLILRNLLPTNECEMPLEELLMKILY